MDITRWIWRLLFSPTKTALFKYIGSPVCPTSVLLHSNHSQFVLLSHPLSLDFILNTMCFDAQSCAFFNDKEFLK